MDIQRANEIMEAPNMIHVQYRGIPVYLQKIHPENQTVTIFPLDDMEHEQIVDVEGLIE
ncbi:H-type small acid-soluble spore protein [Lederbergia sp. NSJ-179]|uniref:H-type small acid-soluble spore protein n=1 Tax=Lederbergia sp. NSJ-179 TaxID=2931402 RepID=UPI001FD39850|nr:H-type small acid-soluble spore protein [Lederbergia sp. NSJ-179]MCJ7841028.1 H-type small acid-soluble spore protein [Lederbergia sp. NSJ-179]